MTQQLEERIRVRAYEIWSATGQIQGQADQHWLTAEREVLAGLATPIHQARATTPRKPGTRAKASAAPKTRAKARQA
jgi:hypothetical protein